MGPYLGVSINPEMHASSLTDNIPIDHCRRIAFRDGCNVLPAAGVHGRQSRTSTP